MPLAAAGAVPGGEQPETAQAALDLASPKDFLFLPPGNGCQAAPTFSSELSTISSSIFLMITEVDNYFSRSWWEVFMQYGQIMGGDGAQ